MYVLFQFWSQYMKMYCLCGPVILKASGCDLFDDSAGSLCSAVCLTDGKCSLECFFAFCLFVTLLIDELIDICLIAFVMIS